MEHLNFITSLTYDYRKLLSHRKIIVRFSCNQAPELEHRVNISQVSDCLAFQSRLSSKKSLLY